MAVFTRVLCPVDNSPDAARAARYAAALGDRHGAGVLFMTVRVPDGRLGLWPAAQVTLDHATAAPPTEAALRQFVQRATGRAQAAVRVAAGTIVSEILRTVRDERIDLLVMGTHGAGGVERFLLGSVTDNVLRQTTVPVLVIPRSAADVPPAEFKTILSAIDRSEAARRALDVALKLSRGCRGRLVLAHVVEHVMEEDAQFAGHFDIADCYRAIEPRLREWYRAFVPPEAHDDCEVDVHLRFGRAGHEVLALARQTGADLVAVGSAATSALFGSTAHHVVRLAAVPVLVVPPAQ